MKGQKTMSNIGAETRATQIAKWRDAVHKNADLLLAFEMKPTDDDLLAKFREDVSARIKDLADYLANGEWGLFLGTELREPPSKEEREAQAEENAARAEAEANAAAAGEIVEAVSTSPLALPEPKCVHFDEKDGCTHADNPHPDGTCDGCWRECANFSLNANPDDTVGGIPKEAFDAAQADIEARKEAEAKVCKFYDRTAGECTVCDNAHFLCVSHGTDKECANYKAKGKAKKGGAK